MLRAKIVYTPSEDNLSLLQKMCPSLPPVFAGNAFLQMG